jgi:hypothetical protein
MELGRTENSEIIFIHTDDLEVTIKGGASGDPPPFGLHSGGDSGRYPDPRCAGSCGLPAAWR